MEALELEPLGGAHGAAGARSMALPSLGGRLLICVHL
jgi:hypothetical protein